MISNSLHMLIAALSIALLCIQELRQHWPGTVFPFVFLGWALTNAVHDWKSGQLSKTLPQLFTEIRLGKRFTNSLKALAMILGSVALVMTVHV